MLSIVIGFVLKILTAYIFIYKNRRYSLNSVLRYLQNIPVRILYRTVFTACFIFRLFRWCSVGIIPQIRGKTPLFGSESKNCAL